MVRNNCAQTVVEALSFDSLRVKPYVCVRWNRILGPFFSPMVRVLHTIISTGWWRGMIGLRFMNHGAVALIKRLRKQANWVTWRLAHVMSA